MLNTNFSSMKTLCSLLYSQYVGSGKLIDGDTGNPSGLALLLDMIHQRILSYPFEWNFLKVKSSFACTGATSYDLSVLFPDLLSVYQIFGINSNQESIAVPDYDANVYPFYDSYQIVGNNLIFTGNVPVAGQIANIQYKSCYMVRDVNGLPKRYFTANDDYTVLNSAFDSLLIYGIGDYVDWISDSKAKEQRDKVAGWFKELFTNLLLSGNPQTSELHNML